MRLRQGALTVSGLLVLVSTATGQPAGEAPPGTPPATPPGTPPPTDAAAPSDGSAIPVSPPAADGNASATAGASVGASTGGAITGAATAGGAADDNDGIPPAEETTEAPPDEPDAATRGLRRRSLTLHPSLHGSVGLIRVVEAGAGAPAMFRLGFATGFFSGSDFLIAGDEAGYVAGDFFLSVTPVSFLEVFGALHSHAASNDQQVPGVLQVLGDGNLGLKAFLPATPDRIWNVGGEVDIQFRNGTGGVGLDGSGTGVAMRGLASLDLTNRTNPEDAFPFKAHLNLGYRVDSTGALVANRETAVQRRISRIERFGLGISRTDFWEVGLGVEAPFQYVNPFLEWTIDIPQNRQGYLCIENRVTTPGDECLGNNSSFGAVPSRLTLGARVHPVLPGLALNGSLDIGTGGTGTFLEETTPELPWQLRFGVSYVVDPVPPAPATKRVEVEKVVDRTIVPPPERYVLGKVVNAADQAPIPGAIVKFADKDETGMVTTSQGTFKTRRLDPGEYAFQVSAAGFRDGTCQVVVPAKAGATPPPDGAAEAPDAAPLPTPSDPSTETRYGIGPLSVLAQMDGGAPPPGAPPPGAPPTGAPPAGAPPTGAPPAGAPPAGAPPAGAPPAGSAPPGAAPPGVDTSGGIPSGNTSDATADDPFASDQAAPIIVNVTCELKALPKVGNVLGTIVDAEGTPLPSAKVRIIDKLGRSLELEVDEAGKFRFENVVPGKTTLELSAEGYLRAVRVFEVKAQEDRKETIQLHPKPKKPHVVIQRNKLNVTKKVLFQTGAATLLPASSAIIEEIADVLRSHPELTLLEVQGHTDNQGEASMNKRLSQERAEAVRTALVRLGVPGDRLKAVGYGQEKPLTSNATDAGRARNRRVEFRILERQ